MLNEEQQAAVLHQDGHALVVAAAGTGKTRTIVARTLHLLEQGVPPSNIILLTFTNKAAEEMRERLSREHSIEGLSAGTFHSFARRQLIQHRDLAEYYDFRVLDADDARTLLKHCLNEAKELAEEASTKSKNERPPFGPGDVPRLSDLQGPISLWRAVASDYPVFKDYLAEFTDFQPARRAASQHVMEQYVRKKDAQKLRDFDDLLADFLAALVERPPFRSRILSKYSHVLVDEMQDTNPVQFAILEQLAGTAQLFCVGDARQSIYRFRGADYKNVHAFKQRLQGAVDYPLKVNYRSNEEVCELANRLLHSSELDYGPNMLSHRGPGGKLRWRDGQDDDDEAAWIAQDILGRRTRAWSDFMILIRARHQAKPLEKALLAAQIPYKYVGGRGLLETAHIRDVISVLLSATRWNDYVAWMRFLQLFPGIGPVTAERSFQSIQDGGLKALNAPKTLSAYLCLEEVLNAKAVVAKVEAAVEGIFECLRGAYTENWDKRVEDLHAFRAVAQGYDTLGEFLDQVSLGEVVTREEVEDRDEVMLVTIHSAKGLEARHCYLVQAQPGAFPSTRSINDASCGPASEGKERIEEDRRVLYVALTRAQDTMTVTTNLLRQQNQPWFLEPVVPMFSPAV